MNSRKKLFIYSHVCKVVFDAVRIHVFIVQLVRE